MNIQRRIRRKDKFLRRCFESRGERYIDVLGNRGSTVIGYCRAHRCVMSSSHIFKNMREIAFLDMITPSDGVRKMMRCTSNMARWQFHVMDTIRAKIPGGLFLQLNLYGAFGFSRSQFQSQGSSMRAQDSTDCRIPFFL